MVVEPNVDQRGHIFSISPKKLCVYLSVIRELQRVLDLQIATP